MSGCIDRMDRFRKWRPFYVLCPQTKGYKHGKLCGPCEHNKGKDNDGVICDYH